MTIGHPSGHTLNRALRALLSNDADEGAREALRLVLHRSTPPPSGAFRADEILIQDLEDFRQEMFDDIKARFASKFYGRSTKAMAMEICFTCEWVQPDAQS